MTHAATMISTMIRKVKFFPVMNGKKSELEIMSGIKGIIKIPENTIAFAKSFIGLKNHLLNNAKNYTIVHARHHK
jgi:hypothetical protein